MRQTIVYLVVPVDLGGIITMTMLYEVLPSSNNNKDRPLHSTCHSNILLYLDSNGPIKSQGASIRIDGSYEGFYSCAAPVFATAWVRAAMFQVCMYRTWK
jgi:hypothetical protein